MQRVMTWRALRSRFPASTNAAVSEPQQFRWSNTVPSKRMRWEHRAGCPLLPRLSGPIPNSALGRAAATRIKERIREREIAVRSPHESLAALDPACHLACSHEPDHARHSPPASMNGNGCHYKRIGLWFIAFPAQSAGQAVLPESGPSYHC
jgi:hypothetical protein